MNKFTFITSTTYNVHSQYVGDSTMDIQNSTSMDIESNRQNLKDLGIIILSLSS